MENRGDAYVALESVMRAHAKGEDRESAVNETETLGKDEENGRWDEMGRRGRR